MQYTYLIVDDDLDHVQDILTKMRDFPEFVFGGTATGKDEAVDKILELRPTFVFLEIDPVNKKSDLSLQVITELYRYLDVLPKFIAVTATTKHAYEAIGAGVFDYIIKPVELPRLRKTLLRVLKTYSARYKDNAGPVVVKPEVANVEENIEEIPITTEIDTGTICIKSYGDYQFVPLNEIIYLEADNNTTDFILQNGRKLTAYKTLKHYETNLPSFFFRIHNSYIINSQHVSRINTGKSLVYLNSGETSIPFSKTFKENIDTLIKLIAPEYL